MPAVPGIPAVTDATISPTVHDATAAIPAVRVRLASLAGWQEAVLAGAAFTVWSLAFRGFDGGRWSDIPVFKSFMDPRLYAKDPFISTLHDGTPAAFTYAAVGALARLLPGFTLDQVLLLLFVPVCIASLAIAHLLCREITGSRVAAALFLFFYIAGFRLVTVGSTILHSAETTPAFVALPLQLGGLLATLQRRHWLAGLTIGLGLNVHAPTTILVALAVGVIWLAQIPVVGPRRPVLGGLVLLLAGAPTVIGSIGQHTDSLPLWALYLAKAELATDISTASQFETWHLRLRNLLGLALLAAAFVVAAPRAYRRELLAIAVAVVLMCLTALVCFDLTLRTPLTTLVARLQFPRSAWLVNVFGLMLVVELLRRAWQERRAPRIVVLALAASLLLSPRDFMPWEPIWPVATLALMASLAAHRLGPAAQPWVGRASGLGVIAVAILVSLAALTGRRVNDIDISQGLSVGLLFASLVALWQIGRRWWAPRRTLAVGGGLAAMALVAALGLARFESWQYERSHAGGLRAAADFQDWARANTPVDSVFLILPSEPNNNSFYERAERALYLVRERANQAVYFPRHNVEFRARLEGLGIDDPVAYKADLDRAYRRLTDEQVRSLARDFGVTHFVPARAGDFSFPVVYQQGGWTVYQVTP